MICVIDWYGKFSAYQIVRDISRQSQIGKALEKLQCEEQVSRHAVAMGLDVHSYPGLIRQSPPAFQ
ncbi:hypothetical protein IVB25_35060 [Bradyrhizobium sp. 193]|nr:hypothetical protein [Bradyrhizobium sp. 193]